MKSEQIAELESAVIGSIEGFKEGLDVPTAVIVGVLNVVSHTYIDAVGNKAEVGHSPKPQEHK